MNGEGNSELSSSLDMDDLSGGEGNSTAMAILGVVASRGWRGAWRAREGARANGFGRYRGRARRFGGGLGAWPAVRRRRRTDTERREGEHSEEGER